MAMLGYENDAHEPGSIPRLGDSPEWDYIWGEMIGTWLNPEYDGPRQLINRTSGVPLGPPGLGYMEAMLGGGHPHFDEQTADTYRQNTKGWWG